MKTTITRWTRLLAALCLLLLAAFGTPEDAQAGEALFRALSMEDAPSASAPTNTVSGTNHRYATVDFAGTGSKTCKVIHFRPFSDYTQGADMSFSLTYTTNGTSTNPTRWEINVGCPSELANGTCSSNGTPRACCTGSGTGTCNNYDTIALSPGTGFSFSPAIAAANASHATTGFSGIADFTGCAGNVPMILQLCRDPAHVSDTNTDTVKIIDVRASW